MIFFLFHIEIEGKGGWIIGGEGSSALPTPMLLSFCVVLVSERKNLFPFSAAGIVPCMVRKSRQGAWA